MKRYIPIALVLVALLFAGCGQDYAAEKQLWHADKGRSEKLKDPELAYDEVIASYEKIIQRYPDWGRNGEVQLTIARLYAAKKDFVQAEEGFKKVMGNYPQDTISSIEAQVGIGSIYEHQGEWEKAEVEYKKVSTIFPHISGNRLLLRTFEMPLYIARHYQMNRQTKEAEEAYEEAIADYQKVVEENKENELGAVAQSYIARAYMNQGKWEEAIEVFQTLIADYPESPRAPVAFYSIGQIYQEQLRLPARAIETYRKYIDDYPNTPRAVSALFRIADVYKTNLDDGKQAIQIYEEIRRKYPQPDIAASALFQTGQVYQDVLKQPDRARAIYRKFLADYPEHNLTEKVKEELEFLTAE